MKELKRCTRCVMDDSSDPTITFDENGFCNYCTKSLSDIGKVYFPDEEGERLLEAKLKEIKEYGKNQKYDCVMGISGGLDSSYLAYLGHKWGLRILAVHIDDGFDTDISQSNIAKLVKAADIDMRVIKPDAEQFYGLTKAYMKAGVPNIAIPQDNVLFAFIYDLMRKEKAKYFLSGGNFALECVLQQGNSYKASDVVNIKDINKRFGETPVNKLKFLSSEKKMYDQRVLNIESPRLLNYIDYNRERAFGELREFCGFEYYGSKHLENVLTAFIQLYWFPKKFGLDKRTSHLSSMIVSGQMTREEALSELQKPMYDEKLMEEYIAIIKEKLRITDKEFDEIMAAPTHQHTDYKTDTKIQTLNKIVRTIKR